MIITRMCLPCNDRVQGILFADKDIVEVYYDRKGKGEQGKQEKDDMHGVELMDIKAIGFILTTVVVQDETNEEGASEEPYVASGFYNAVGCTEVLLFHQVVDLRIQR